MVTNAYIEGPRLYRITGNDYGPLVLVTSYITLSLALLSKATRIFLRLIMSRSWNLEDYVAIVAMSLSVFHSVTMNQSYKYGLGKHSALLTSDTIRKFDYTIYTASLLYISAIVASKVSILIFIHRLTPFRAIRQICQVFLIVVGLWWLSTCLVTVFACNAPHFSAYSSGKCIDFASFYLASGVIDIVTDVFLVILPAYVFSTIQFKQGGRAAVVGLFAVRVLAVIPAILRLRCINKTSFDSGEDLSWTIVPFLAYTSIHMNVSIICASIPSVRPLLRKLESGYIVASMRKQQHGGKGRIRPSNQPAVLATMNTWASKVLETKSQPAHLSALPQHGIDGNGALAHQSSLEPLTEMSAPPSRGSDINDASRFARALRPDYTDYQSNITGTELSIEGPDRYKSCESLEEEAELSRMTNATRMSIVKTTRFAVMSEERSQSS